MRIIYFLSFIFLILTPSFGQNFGGSGSEWILHNNGGSQPAWSEFQTYTYEKDTIINDTTCNLISNGNCYYSKNDSVYLYVQYQNRFNLVYDFTAETGDHLKFPNPSDASDTLNATVIDIIEEEYDGYTIKHFKFDNNSQVSNYREKVGSEHMSPHLEAYIPEASTVNCYKDDTISINLYEGRECIELSTKNPLTEKSIKVVPNPFDNFIVFTSPENGELTFHDLTGNLIDVFSLTEGKNRLNMNQFKPGAYLYTLKTKSGILNGKIIKSR